MNDDSDENPFTLTVSGTASGTPEIAVSSSIGGAVSDAGTDAQGARAAGSQVTVTYTVTNSGTGDLTLATATSSGASNVTVDTIGAPGSTTVVGGGGTTTFQVQYTPSLAGAFSFDLSFVNDDSDENPFTLTVSGTAIDISLTVAIEEFTGSLNGDQTTEIVLSNSSTDFDVSDLSLTNATATMTGSGVSYTAVLTPLADGEVSLSVAQGVFADEAGTLNTASNSVSMIADITPPDAPSEPEITFNSDGSITISGTLEPGTWLTVTFPSGQTVSTSDGARAKVLGSANVPYSITSEPNQPSGSFTMVATDLAGNVSDTSSFVAQSDVTAPSVTLSAEPDTFAYGVAFTVDIDFSEAVTGFIAGDVSAIHANVTGLTGSGANYVATIMPTGSGDIELSVAAGVAQDGAGNLNEASNSLRVANTIVAKTQEKIAGFMHRRANQLVGNQPDLIGRLSGTHRGNFNGQVTRGSGSFDFASPADKPYWIQLTGSWSDSPGAETRYVFGAIGTDWVINPNLRLGVMLEFDDISDTDGLSSISGTGWLVGPYVVGRFENQPLYYEARLLYGQTDNRISPFGTYEDQFKTDRVLASVKIAGQIDYQELTVVPSLLATYTTDTQREYTDSLGNTIGEQEIRLAEISVGVDTSRPIYTSRGDTVLTGGIKSIWAWSDSSAQAAMVVPEHEGGRARIDIGIDHVTEAGLQFSVSAYYDGIGARNYSSMGGEFNLVFNF